MDYHCSKCSAVVIVDGDDKQYSCNCGASIVAEMSGEAHGHGGIKM